MNLWQAGRIAGLATATRKASVSLAEREGDEVVTDSARLKVPLAVGSLPRARRVVCCHVDRNQGCQKSPLGVPPLGPLPSFQKRSQLFVGICNELSLDGKSDSSVTFRGLCPNRRVSTLST